jgi:Domain of unknown function (DUF5106)/Domain of unknown function (DUF4369)
LKHLLFILVLIPLSFFASAKDGCVVKGTIRNNTDSLVFLCYYYGSTSIVQKLDSAFLSKGTAKFSMTVTKKITDGFYMLLFADKSPQIEIVLDNGKEVNVEMDKEDILHTIKFINDEQNTAFYDDKLYINNLQPRIKDLTAKLESKKKKDTTFVNAQYEEMNAGIFKYRDALIAKDPKSTLAVIYTSMKEPVLPATIKAMPDGRKKDSLKYVFIKKNYWNDWNFKDDRLIYSPVYEGKLAGYFNNLVLQTPDSFNLEADKIMKNVTCGSDMYKFTFWWITRTAGMSKVMGMDESYVYMIEKYVMGQDYCPGLDSASKAAYITDAQRLAKNTMGKIGMDIVMPDDKEQTQSLHHVCTKGDFTVLAFYDPTCHHCEKEVPSMDSTLNILEKQLGITIMRFGLENADEDPKWIKFIADKKLNNHWVHVHNPSRIGNYRADYNILTNPVFYLLDKKAEIIGKRIDHTNIGGLIKHLWEERNTKK